MEKDNDIKAGEGNSIDFGERMYDPRIGRWFKTDGYEGRYPSTSPYVFAKNNPIYLIDHVGDSVKVYVSSVKVGEVKINLYSAKEIKKNAKLKNFTKVVPVYKVTVTNQSSNDEYTFYYTRDAFRGKTDGSVEEVTFDVNVDGDRFLGKVKSRWKGTDNVLELRAFDDVNNQTIHGLKAGVDADRTAIQLHVLGASDGCLLAVGSGQFICTDEEIVTTSLAVNSSGSQMNFMNKVKAMLKEDKKWNCSDVIVVQFQKGGTINNAESTDTNEVQPNSDSGPTQNDSEQNNQQDNDSEDDDGN